MTPLERALRLRVSNAQSRVSAAERFYRLVQQELADAHHELGHAIRAQSEYTKDEE